ncbi:MAG: PAS domain S-box protein [Deltaproteobacteria bacterium]|nr:PAS domain S-box protein [Deltaproteobacteria bacterium]
MNAARSIPAERSIPAGWVGTFAGRLIALTAILGVAVLVDARGTGQYSERELDAIYALALIGFGIAVATGALTRQGWGVRRIVRVEFVADAVLLTALLYCSGGARSLFGGLYLIWIVSGAVRAGSFGAAFTSIAATLGYGVAALLPATGWLPAFEARPAPAPDEALAYFGIHVAGFLAVALLAHRLTDQLRLRQDELIELGDLHARIVDNVSSGLLTVDQLDRITSFNQEAERITGYRREEVMGRGLSKLFTNLRDLEGRAPVHRLELPFENRAGGTLHLGFSRSPLRDGRGETIGAVLIFQDLTHVRAMEEELRRSERLTAVGQLAAGLAHEIRNPLGSLSGAIELLAGDLPDADATSRRLLRIVGRETERLNRLVSDFLVYAGTRPVELERIELAPLLDEVAGLVAKGEHAGLPVEIDVPADAAVLGSPDQLRQVFWNLLLNAAQSEPSDGRVRIRARAVDENRIEVEVSDRGRGIAPESLERIFEPFYTTRSKGTGLGLALVHRMVEAHGGQISVQSEVSQGTSVRLVLSAPGSATAPGSAAAEGPGDGSERA